MEIQCSVWSTWARDGWHHHYSVSSAQDLKRVIPTDKSHEAASRLHRPLHLRLGDWIQRASQTRRSWALWQGWNQFHRFFHSFRVRKAKDWAPCYPNGGNAMDVRDSRLSSTVQDSLGWRRPTEQQAEQGAVNCHQAERAKELHASQSVGNQVRNARQVNHQRRHQSLGQSTHAV